jgi:hypothetical protein
LVKTLTPKLGDVQLRVANLGAAAGGLLDGSRAIGEADLTVVSLPTMANRGDSEALFCILMADLGHWTATRKGRRPAQVMVDEFSALDGGRDYAIDLFERGRGAGVPVVLSGQSYRSLGDEDQRDRLVSAADALVLFGSATPDELIRLAGTVLEAEAVWQVGDGQLTGRASLSRRHRAKVEPNVIRQLGGWRGRDRLGWPGRAATGGPGPRAGNGLPASLPAGPLHPAGPAVAVDGREVPPPGLPRQGPFDPPGRPSGGLDPSGRPSVRQPRPPVPGWGGPPDGRGKA